MFDRVLNYEINRARVRMEERAHEKAEAEQRKTALRARSHSEAKLTCSEGMSGLSISTHRPFFTALTAYSL